MNPDTISFLQVGGTIDKDYPQGVDNHGYSFEIGDAAFSTILDERANVHFEYVKETIMHKDSLDMTGSDRIKVAQHVRDDDVRLTIITHGTDTIHLTAEVIAETNSSLKTVILTGATRPERFRDSDADFNLGMAVGAIRWVPPGVYIALNGEVKHWMNFVPS